PAVPFLSNLTGAWIRAEEATDPAYWMRQLRHTVRFADGTAELLREPGRVLLEVGPGSALCSFVKACPGWTAAQPVIASLRRQRDQAGDEEHLCGALGKLWLAGVEPDWQALHGGGR